MKAGKILFEVSDNRYKMGRVKQVWQIFQLLLSNFNVSCSYE